MRFTTVTAVWIESGLIHQATIGRALASVLSKFPRRARRCEHVRPGLWRMEAGSHVLFFRRLGDDVLVCRILHHRMLPEYQPIDDDYG
jgi:plasmid stabilization system protein ParE